MVIYHQGKYAFVGGIYTAYKLSPFNLLNPFNPNLANPHDCRHRHIPDLFQQRQIRLPWFVIYQAIIRAESFLSVTDRLNVFYILASVALHLPVKSFFWFAPIVTSTAESVKISAIEIIMYVIKFILRVWWRFGQIKGKGFWFADIWRRLFEKSNCDWCGQTKNETAHRRKRKLSLLLFPREIITIGSNENGSRLRAGFFTFAGR